VKRSNRRGSDNFTFCYIAMFICAYLLSVGKQASVFGAESKTPAAAKIKVSSEHFSPHQSKNSHSTGASGFCKKHFFIERASVLARVLCIAPERGQH